MSWPAKSIVWLRFFFLRSGLKSQLYLNLRHFSKQKKKKNRMCVCLIQTLACPIRMLICPVRTLVCQFSLTLVSSVGGQSPFFRWHSYGHISCITDIRLDTSANAMALALDILHLSIDTRTDIVSPPQCHGTRPDTSSSRFWSVAWHCLLVDLPASECSQILSVTSSWWPWQCHLVQFSSFLHKLAPLFSCILT